MPRVEYLMTSYSPKKPAWGKISKSNVYDSYCYIEPAFTFRWDLCYTWSFCHSPFLLGHRNHTECWWHPPVRRRWFMLKHFLKSRHLEKCLLVFNLDFIWTYCTIMHIPRNSAVQNITGECLASIWMLHSRAPGELNLCKSAQTRAVDVRLNTSIWV